MVFPVICIDGIIGVGKTTAVQYIGKLLNFDTFLEPINDSLLKIYYEDQNRWGFPFQIDMLNRRFIIQLEAMNYSLNSRGVILDRSLLGDRVFAKMLWKNHKIHDLEWQIYEHSYTSFIRHLTPPNLLIYLDISPENAYRRIKNRARVAESEDVLPIEYLERLYQEYCYFIDQIQSGNHIWSSGMETWVIDWNRDWQPFDPLIKKIVDRFDLKNSSNLKGQPNVKDSVLS